jgi:hypothetical protein
VEEAEVGFEKGFALSSRILHSFNAPDFFLDRGKEAVLIITMVSKSIDILVYPELRYSRYATPCSVWRSPNESTSMAMA